MRFNPKPWLLAMTPRCQSVSAVFTDIAFPGKEFCYCIRDFDLRDQSLDRFTSLDRPVPRPTHRGPSRKASPCSSSEDTNWASTGKLISLTCPFIKLLTLIATFTGWMEALPTSRKTADVTAQVLLEHSIPQFDMLSS